MDKTSFLAKFRCDRSFLMGALVAVVSLTIGAGSAFSAYLAYSGYNPNVDTYNWRDAARRDVLTSPSARRIDGDVVPGQNELIGNLREDYGAAHRQDTGSVHGAGLLNYDQLVRLCNRKIEEIGGYSANLSRYFRCLNAAADGIQYRWTDTPRL